MLTEVRLLWQTGVAFESSNRRGHGASLSLRLVEGVDLLVRLRQSVLKPLNVSLRVRRNTDERADRTSTRALVRVRSLAGNTRPNLVLRQASKNAAEISKPCIEKETDISLVVVRDDWSRAAYLVLEQLYLCFNVPVDKIPYVSRDNNEARVNIPALK